jgi:exopolyphosphatase/guanosine-5'-triphosphate,3'-diphosphate pyrophosphatase
MKSIESERQNDTEAMAQIRRFAQGYAYEQGHVEQVLKLSELLFEKLAAVHGLNSDALFLLRCAAILHDIGWINGQAKHHKTAMRLILEARQLPLTEEERTLAALIARYHRKAAPKPDHTVYRDLSAERQRDVQYLGGILRIADGLDRTHQSVVEDVNVRISEEKIEFRCRVRGTAQLELAAAQKKADVFENSCGRKAYFTVLHNKT